MNHSHTLPNMKNSPILEGGLKHSVYSCFEKGCRNAKVNAAIPPESQYWMCSLYFLLYWMCSLYSVVENNRQSYFLAFPLSFSWNSQVKEGKFGLLLVFNFLFFTFCKSLINANSKRQLRILTGTKDHWFFWWATFSHAQRPHRNRSCMSEQVCEVHVYVCTDRLRHCPPDVQPKPIPR